MANRFFNQFGGTLERKVVKLFAKINIVSGAPVLVTSEVLNAGTSPVTINPSQGFAFLIDNSNGEFTLILGNYNGGTPSYDPYVRLLGVNVTGVGAFNTAAVGAVVTDDNVDGAVGAGPSLRLQLGTPTGAALPADGQVVLVEVTLSNTTAY